MAAAGHQRVAGEPRRGGRQLPHGEAVQSVVETELCKLIHPIEEVLAAVPARRFRARGHRQVDFAADVEQFLGDLAAGLAGADDEHGTLGSASEKFGVFRQNASHRSCHPAKRLAPFQQLVFDPTSYLAAV